MWQILFSSDPPSDTYPAAAGGSCQLLSWVCPLLSLSLGSDARSRPRPGLSPLPELLCAALFWSQWGAWHCDAARTEGAIHVPLPPSPVQGGGLGVVPRGWPGIASGAGAPGGHAGLIFLPARARKRLPLCVLRFSLN